jgi:hypothetical protein
MTETTDYTQDDLELLEASGFYFFTTSWGRSIWKHPEHPARTFFLDEALAVVGEGRN